MDMVRQKEEVGLNSSPEKQSAWKLIQQFVKFNIVGLLNTLIDNGLYWLLNTKVGLIYWLAKTLSYSAGIVNSWIWNSRWTFANKGAGNTRKAEKSQEGGVKRFLSFVLVNLASLGVSLLVLHLCKKIWRVEPAWWMNLFLATPASLLVNFAGNKWFVFRKEDAEVKRG